MSADLIARLRHLYANLAYGGVMDKSQAKRIATGLLGPVIEEMEASLAAALNPVTAAQPSESPRAAEPVATRQMIEAGAAIIEHETNGRYRELFDGTPNDTARLVWDAMRIATLPRAAEPVYGSALRDYRRRNPAAALSAPPSPESSSQGSLDDSAPESAEPLTLARRFHEAYERLAPGFGYTTKPETRHFDPESTNGQLMIAVCEEILAARASAGSSRGAANKKATPAG